MLLGASLPVQAQEGAPTLHQGLLLDLGGAMGFGDRSAFDVMLGAAWQGENLRFGVQAGGGVVLQKGDDTTDISGPVYGGGYYAVQEDASIDVFHRFYVLPRADIVIPLGTLVDLTIGGGVGPAWISKVNSRLVGGGLPMEDNPGLLVRANLGLDILRNNIGIRIEMGFENQSYTIACDGVSKDFSDPKFLMTISSERLFSFGKRTYPKTTPKAAFSPAWKIPTDPAAKPQDSAAGSRSPESILKVIRANIGDFQHIYERHLKENPGIGGKISFKFTIAPSGDIIAISVVSSNTGDSDLDDEIKDKARHMKFDPIEKGNVTVTYAFVLENQ